MLIASTDFVSSPPPLQKAWWLQVWCLPFETLPFFCQAAAPSCPRRHMGHMERSRHIHSNLPRGSFVGGTEQILATYDILGISYFRQALSNTSSAGRSFSDTQVGSGFSGQFLMGLRGFAWVGLMGLLSGHSETRHTPLRFFPDESEESFPPEIQSWFEVSLKEAGGCWKQWAVRRGGCLVGTGSSFQPPLLFSSCLKAVVWQLWCGRS